MRLLPFSLILLAMCVSATFTNAQQRQFSGPADSLAQRFWPQRPVGFVNDYDSLFKPAERSRLERRIKQFTDSNGYEICIVTLRPEPGVKGGLDSLGTLISNSWGVGSKAYNDGVTIVICAGCREMRIANGLGTIQILSDPQTKAIIDGHFLPAFKRGEYFAGVEAGLQRLMDELRGKRPPPMD